MANGFSEFDPALRIDVDSATLTLERFATVTADGSFSRARSTRRNHERSFAQSLQEAEKAPSGGAPPFSGSVVKRAQTGGRNSSCFIVDIIHTILLCTRLPRRTVCAFLGGTYALRGGARFSVSGTTVFLVGFLCALPLCGPPGFSYVLLSPSFSLRLASQSGH